MALVRTEHTKNFVTASAGGRLVATRHRVTLKLSALLYCMRARTGITHAENGQFRTFSKPDLVRLHYLSGMGSLADIMSKTF